MIVLLIRRGDFKRCTQCNWWKHRGAFYASTYVRDGLRSNCKKCVSGTGAKWYAENRERKLADNAKWYAENRERKHQLNAEYGASLRGRIAMMRSQQNWKAKRTKERIHASL